MISKRIFLLAVTIAFSASLWTGCAPHPRFRDEPVKRRKSETVKKTRYHKGQTLRGKASYYGPKFHGRKTSNGEVFDMNAMTAAHKSMPFGTILEVTNSNNGKSCRVRINDRGPFIPGRIIDLSMGAAQSIDMVGDGVVEVEIRIISLGDN